MKDVVICANATSLDSQLCVTDALREFPHNTRVFLSEHSLRNFLTREGAQDFSIWVAGSLDVDPINVCATLLDEYPQSDINLVVGEITGSLASRSSTLGIKTLVTFPEFIYEVRRRFEGAEISDSGAGVQHGICGGAKIEQTGSGEGVCDTVSQTQKQAQEVFCERQMGLSTNNFGLSESGSFVLSVASTSGGSGKSTISAIAAHLCAGMGYKTLCLDLDLQFGDVAQISGVANCVTFDDVLEDGDTLARLASNAGDLKPAIVAPPARLERGDVVNDYIGSIVGAAGSLFDVIVVNTGAVWIDYHAQLLEFSDRIAFVMDQRASSVRSTRHALELCSRLGVSDANFFYLLNRCSRSSAFCAVDISCALDGGSVYEIKDGGSIVEELLGVGKLDELVHQKNDMCTSVSAALHSVFETSPKLARKLKDDRFKAGGVQAGANDSAAPRKTKRKKRFGKRGRNDESCGFDLRGHLGKNDNASDMAASWA